MATRVETTSPGPVSSPAPAKPYVIEPGSSWAVDMRELWEYRELFFFLVWRDIKVRYAQTVLGAGWAILQPVLTMLVFSVIFGSFAKIPSDGVPYPIFSLAALIPWTYFSKALTGSSASLVSSVPLVTKVYFPRLVIPLAPPIAGLVDFVIGFAILLLMMAGFRVTPTMDALYVVPVLTFVSLIAASGVGAWLAALNIQYRDVKYVVPFLVQIWMYGSPIVYPLSIVPEQYRLLYSLNPMVGVVEGFRASLLGTNPVSLELTVLSLGVGTLFLVTGALYYRYTERVFADVA